MNHLHFEMDFNWSCGAEKVKDRLKETCDAFWKPFHAILKPSLDMCWVWCWS